jgi:DNA-binding MarR family transcriptional regulator
MTMNAFAAKLGVSPPSATSFVERLVRLGYVRRSVDRRNRRLVHLTLTTRGSRTLAKEMKEHARMFREVLRGLSTTELNDLRRILERLLVSVSSNV